MSVSVLASLVHVTGSTTILNPNFLGLGGTLVIQSGNNVLISGAGQGGGGSGDVTQVQLSALSGFVTGISGILQQQIAQSSAGVVSINGLSGQLNLVGVNGITVSPSEQTFYVSGQDDVYVHRTGNELITGIKTFVDMTSGLSGFGIARDAAYYQDGKLALRVFNRTTAPLDKHIMVGSDSRILSGLANTFIGAPVGLNAFSSASYTIAIGNKDTLSNLRTGDENTVIGDTSFPNLQIGGQNTVIGGSIAINATGSYANIALGNYSLSVMKTGSHNIAIGRFAGGVSYFDGVGVAASGLVTGNNNILIGHNTKTTGLCSDNFLNIADSIFGSNIYQNTGSRIGICHRSPQFNLHVSGDVGFASIATTTSANAGTATLPGNPVGFVIINITGGNFKIPYYNIYS